MYATVRREIFLADAHLLLKDLYEMHVILIF
jgi:hypothetical protein